MDKYVLIGLFAGILFMGDNVGAKEVSLDQGETYRQGDLTVTCGNSSIDNPLALKECQHWDDFNKKCLFEKTTFTNDNIECVEECQHWDNFQKTCHYQTKCVFYPSHKSFVQTSCEKFDDFNNICEKTRDTKIAR